MFIPSHVWFISKSNSENCIEIRYFLTKLQTKISWLLFMAHGVGLGLVGLVLGLIELSWNSGPSEWRSQMDIVSYNDNCLFS